MTKEPLNLLLHSDFAALIQAGYGAMVSLRLVFTVASAKSR
jgi:hypothetical protein